MNKFFFTLTSFFFLFSCGMQNNSDEKKNEILSSIESLEKNIQSNLHNFSPALADSLGNAYTSFAKTFPKDSMAAEYMFKAADITISTRNFKKAISIFDTIPTLYPKFKRNPDCLFMIAFIYDEHLKLKDEAATAYEKMIEVFPEHRLAKDAKIQKENLKYTNEELIKMFESKNAKLSQ